MVRCAVAVVLVALLGVVVQPAVAADAYAAGPTNLAAAPLSLTGSTSLTGEPQNVAVDLCAGATLSSPTSVLPITHLTRSDVLRPDLAELPAEPEGFNPLIGLAFTIAVAGAAIAIGLRLRPRAVSFTDYEGIVRR
jgi:hypothetical protein